MPTAAATTLTPAAAVDAAALVDDTSLGVVVSVCAAPAELPGSGGVADREVGKVLLSAGLSAIGPGAVASVGPLAAAPGAALSQVSAALPKSIANS
jgi:hypothetical protein